MWPLASFPANAIPIQKSNDALIMLTDWAPDVHADKALINLVAKHYRQMHIWFQGEGDEAYFARIANELSTNITTRISTIPHRLIAFEQFLTSGIDFDYIGTRLHGGVRCLLGKHRSLIIAVDHRAVEIANDTRLSVAQRNDLTTVAMWIDQPQSLQIQMPQTAIDQWRRQRSPRSAPVVCPTVPGRALSDERQVVHRFDGEALPARPR